MQDDNKQTLSSKTWKDAYLTYKPEITFFRNRPKQHTPFVMDFTEFNFNKTLNFGDEGFCAIHTDTDILDSIILKITLPQVQISNRPDIRNLDNNSSQIITYKNNSLTLSDMVNHYSILIEKFTKFNESAMIYYRGIKSAVLDANTNYTTITNLAHEYLSNNDDIIQIYYANDEFNSVNIADTDLVFDFSILTKIYSGYTSYETSLYNTELTKSYKNVIKGYLESYIEFRDIHMKYLYNVRDKFANLLNISESMYYRFAWVANIGLAIIKKISIEIGGEMFDYHDKYTLDNYYKQYIRNEYNDAYNNMLGNIDKLTSFDTEIKPEYSLLIKIPFGLFIHRQSNIPIAGILYSDIIVRLKLEELSNVCFFEPDDISQSYTSNINLGDLIKLKSVSLMVNIVYLKDKERNKLSTSTVEILIEQHRILSFKNIDRQRANLSLEFANSLKDINWTIQKRSCVEQFKLWNNYDLLNIYTGVINGRTLIDGFTNYINVVIDGIIDSDKYTKCKIYHSKYYNGEYKILSFTSTSSFIIKSSDFIYSDKIKVILLGQWYEPVEEEYIQIQGTSLDTPKEASYYKYVNSYNRTHGSEIHKRSLALIPESLQPSGVLNFNTIKNKQLSVIFNSKFMDNLKDNNDSLIINIIGRSYNTMIIEKGYCVLAFGY